MKNLIKDFLPFLVTVLLAWILFSCVGCTTLKKATEFMNDHPDQAAGYCAEKFPVQDSIGHPEITFGQGNNEDYTGSLDSLKHLVAALLDSLNAITRPAPVDTGQVQQNFAPCAELQRYKDIARRLTDQIFSLNARYKPCAPDTIRITLPFYRTNTAMVEHLRGQYAAQRATTNQLTEERDKWKALALKLGGGLALAIILMALGIYLRIKRII
ncbi:MAG: hypothetical protein JO301_17010 [Chitinophagaceae bacterium]|nr:hypothetical protein [Chitinophagaceae bacterium]